MIALLLVPPTTQQRPETLPILRAGTALGDEVLGLSNRVERRRAVHVCGEFLDSDSQTYTQTYMTVDVFITIDDATLQRM